MLITGRTDKGLKRQTNQDAFAAGEIAGGCYAVVCDGMGGQQGGEVASRIACEYISGAIMRGFTMPLKGQAVDIWIKGALESAARQANKTVLEESERDHDLRGMGTTLVAALIIGGMAYIIHAGDSRAYLMRGGRLSRLTTDHTMVQALLERGDITESESRAHPQRHYITRALGVAHELECTFTAIELEAHDRILLCTDGLYNFIEADALEGLVKKAVDNACADVLIDAANDGGGGDNITAVLLGREEAVI